MFNYTFNKKFKFLLIVLTLVVILFYVIYLIKSKCSNNLKIVGYMAQNGIPHIYEDKVDFRIIVLAYNRANSLDILLNQLNSIELDGDVAKLEIWIDREKKNNKVNAETLKIARNFSWYKGIKRVHIQKRHVGIYGQWMDTWMANNPNTNNETVLFLEDDMSVSPYIYRWLKVVHRRYGSRKDFGGVTLQSDNVVAHNTGEPINNPSDSTVFMYICFGTWGFSPSAKVWNDFQDWFHVTIKTITKFDTGLLPYVKNTIPSTWYKNFECSGKQDSMWEMWLIYYMDQFKLFTVYNNLHRIISTDNKCLSYNRKEKGLHFEKKNLEKQCELIDRWNTSYINFPENPIKYDWNGKVVNF